MFRKNKGSKQYNLHKVSILIFLYWIYSIVSLTIIKGRVKFGIGDDVKIADIKINTWHKYVAVIANIVIGQFINTLATYKIAPFYTNVVRDYKTKTIPYSKLRLIILRANYSIYYWIHGILRLFVYFSLELQFYIIMMGTDVLVDLIIHWNYLDKKIHNEEINDSDDSDDSYDKNDAKYKQETFTLL